MKPTSFAARATSAAYRSPSKDLARGIHFAAGSVLDDAIRASTPTESSYLRERHEALTCALTTPCVAFHEEPATLKNGSNGGQGTSVAWMHARAASRKAQRALGERIARAFREDFITTHRLFYVVVLTRIAPRSLDGPNLDVTFKSVIDGIATGLGIDDSSSLVRYVTSQRKGEPRQSAVRAELYISPTKEKTT